MSGRRYGFFRCSDCGANWESAYVFCVEGSNTRYYEQDCKRCNTSCQPDRVERLKCSRCGLQDCICSKAERKERHSDPNKPHRSDLCHRCRSGRPCLH